MFSSLSLRAKDPFFSISVTFWKNLCSGGVKVSAVLLLRFNPNVADAFKLLEIVKSITVLLRKLVYFVLFHFPTA